MKLHKELLVATKNKGKIAEFVSLFAPLGIEVKSLHDVDDAPDVVEDGDTFAANAWKKAKEIAALHGIATLADDSGLCVDLLGGAPGVYSARYAGPHASDGDNNAKLLRTLAEQLPAGENASAADPVPEDKPRKLSPARFVCVLALYDPGSGEQLEVEGVCEGFIIDELRGEGGFGYDPLFYIPEAGLTMAQLSVEQKNELSHRGRALRALWSQLMG